MLRAMVAREENAWPYPGVAELQRSKVANYKGLRHPELVAVPMLPIEGPTRSKQPVQWLLSANFLCGCLTSQNQEREFI